MSKNNYKPKYTRLFRHDVIQAQDYIAYTLCNPIAAERLVDEIDKAVERRLFNPTGYRKYHSAKDREQPYYTIRVKNYLIFYVVIGDTMEIRRFIYNKRDLTSLI